MTEFTPVTAAAGGALIGAAAVLLLGLNGRIAGISGILNGVFSRDAGERNWRLFFVAGLVVSGIIARLLTGEALIDRVGYPLPLLLAAGFLVGIGTRLGSGCTSGHGVCGISRLSVRSLVATLTFIAFGIVTTTIVRLSGVAS